MGKSGFVSKFTQINYIKGIASLSVVLLHCMPNYYIVSPIWIGQAVPIFLFISAYLTYSSFERGKTLKDYYSKNSIVKLFNRIFKPFFYVLALQIFIFYLFKNDFSIKGIILSGGIGPGSYYPWVYLQTWLFLPLIIKITDSFSLRSSFTIFLCICIILEVVTSLLSIHELIYRMTFYRYIFVLYLACIVQKFNIKINLSVIILALISITYSLIATYTNLNFEPIFFFSGWRSQTWISYFYTVLVFLVLERLYILQSENLITKILVYLGNYSYEIFLCQMFIFSFLSLNNFSFIGNVYFENLLFIITATFLSVVPVIFYKKCKQNLFFMTAKKDI